MSVVAKHLKLDLSSSSRGKFTENENIILIDDTLSVLCSYDNPDTVNPPPSLKLFMVQRHLDHHTMASNEPILMAKGGIDRLSPSNKFIGFNQLKATKKINREDMDRYIVCERTSHCIQCLVCLRIQSVVVSAFISNHGRLHHLTL